MEFLRRSRNAPLSITVSAKDLSSPRPQTNTLLSKDTLARMRAFQVTTSPDRLTDVILPLLSSPAPALEISSIDLIERFPQSSQSQRRLPAHLFAGNAPRLRSFSSHFLSIFPAYPAIFENLRTFSVVNMRSNDGYEFPQWDQAIDALTSMHNLESLELRECLPRTELTVTLPPSVYLPELNDLKIMDSLHATTIVLRLFRVRSACQIRLECRTQAATIGEDLGLFGNAITCTGLRKYFSPSSIIMTQYFPPNGNILRVEAFHKEVPLVDIRESCVETEAFVVDIRGSHVYNPVYPNDFLFTLDLQSRNETTEARSHIPNLITNIAAKAFSFARLRSAGVYFNIDESRLKQDLHTVWSTAFAQSTGLSSLACGGTAGRALLRDLKYRRANPHYFQRCARCATRTTTSRGTSHFRASPSLTSSRRWFNDTTTPAARYERCSLANICPISHKGTGASSSSLVPSSSSSAANGVSMARQARIWRGRSLYGRMMVFWAMPNSSN
jgi:hypothetical protein